MPAFEAFRDRARLVLIAGPCVIESEEHVNRMVDAIAPVAAENGFSYFFKASFDKANRTSLSGYRGPGPKEGLRILAGIRRRGYSVLTDIHEPAQAAVAAEAADILQIPAFLCRQTDLLLEAGRTGAIVNVKKGQFVAPHDIHHAAEKVASTGNQKVVLTERGSSFGYNNLVVDMRGLRVMAASPAHVFAMKARAARTRDIDDLRLLADIIGVNSADAALRICVDFYPDEPVSARSAAVLHELFD
jgi:2-dehydro-3-deoxyphosphooctonate aldolase (KDO 8-P synthase)